LSLPFSSCTVHFWLLLGVSLWKFAAFKILLFVFSFDVPLFASLSASLYDSICHIFSSSFSFSFASVRA
jgi:hypothetical protein